MQRHKAIRASQSPPHPVQQRVITWCVPWCTPDACPMHTPKHATTHTPTRWSRLRRGHIGAQPTWARRTRTHAGESTCEAHSLEMRLVESSGASWRTPLSNSGRDGPVRAVKAASSDREFRDVVFEDLWFEHTSLLTLDNWSVFGLHTSSWYGCGMHNYCQTPDSWDTTFLNTQLRVGSPWSYSDSTRLYYTRVYN